MVERPGSGVLAFCSWLNNSAPGSRAEMAMPTGREQGKISPRQTPIEEALREPGARREAVIEKQ